MARLICRLPSSDPPSDAEAAAAGIGAWLVELRALPCGELALQAPPDWLARPKAQLPWCLELVLTATMSPAAERQLSRQLATWLAQASPWPPIGRPLLWVRDPERLSQPHFAAARLRQAHPAELVLLAGGTQPAGFAGGYARPWRDGRCKRFNGTQLNYLSFLAEAHHPPQRAEGIWVPAVLPWSPALDACFANASAEFYREWLDQASAWADLWHLGSGQEALVLVEGWAGHQRWWMPPEPPPQPPADAGSTTAEVVWQGWGTLDSSQPAVLVHGYWLERLATLLDGLGDGEDPQLCLYVSTPAYQLDQVAQLVRQRGWQRVRLAGCANRGRDIAPFLLHLLPAALAAGHPWLLKLHTKQSSHLGQGEAWGAHLSSHLATAAAVRNLASQFEREASLGVLTPPGSLLPLAVTLHRNGHHLSQLASRLGLSGRWLLGQPFCAGSMFAARREALTPLLGLELELGAFEPEQGQEDGTLAHSLERLVVALATRAGYGALALPGDAAAVPGFGHRWAAPGVANGSPYDR